MTVSFLRPSWTTLSLVLVFIIACNQATDSKSDDKAKNEISAITTIDTLQFVILPFDKSMDWMFDKSYEPTTLTQNEIIQTDSLLNECVTNYNKTLKDNKIDLTAVNYKRQYVPVVNKKEQKEVWINCFCQSHGNSWKRSVLNVDGGGNCYFNFKVNLTENKYYDLWVNAPL